MRALLSGAILVATFFLGAIAQAEEKREIEWRQSCPVGASPATRCGELIVPERRDRADSREIRVPIALIPAPDQERKAKDPLLFLMGGTGGGYGVLHQLGMLPTFLNRDVLVVEQRGNPMATPYFGCENVPSAIPLHRLYNSVVDYTGQESVDACKRDLAAKGIDLQAYTTPYAVDDLIDLRRALGIEQWNVYGISYGGRVGTTLMRKDGAAIRSLTIDSAQITGTWFSSWERLKAVNLFFERCAAAPQCGAQFPNLRQTFEQTLTRLSKRPVRIRYAGKRDTLNDYGYLHLVVWSLYQLGLDQTSQLPAAIEASGRGDFNALLAINSIYGDYEPPRLPPNKGYTQEGDHNAQQISVLCAEEFPYNKDVDEPAEARAAGWGDAAVALLADIERREREVCDAWGFEADAPEQAAPPVGDRPTLIVYAEHDTIAPPSHGEIALRSLDNAQLVVFPWTAHGVISERQDCFFQIFIPYLNNPAAPLDLSCVRAIPEPAWAPLSAQPGGANPLGLVHANAANSLARFGFPGRGVYVVAPKVGVNGVVTVGTADAQRSLPLTGRETLRIASQTKTFTAVAILRLVEEGLLDLDASVAGLLTPALVETLERGGYQPQSITVRQLLNHTSGLPDHSLDAGYQAAIVAEPLRQWTAQEQVEWGAVRMSKRGAPGEAYVYSDTGYVLLGDVIQRATKKNLAAAVRSLLDYDAIGLNETWFETLEPAPADAPTQAEQFAGGQPTSMVNPSFDLYGGGGIVSTLEDQAVFLRALFAERVFKKPGTLEIMTTVPDTNRNPRSGDGYALGIVRATVDGVICWGHSGFFGSSGYHCPDADITVTSSRYRAEGHPTYDGAGALKSAILMQRLRTEPADSR